MLPTDIRHAFRTLARRPGFTLVAVLTLSLGIGASTAIFSALYHTLLRPMPFAGGERLMYVWLSGGQMMISPTRDYREAWRGRTRSFDLVSEYAQGEHAVYGGTSPEVVGGVAIERDLPARLEVQPILGRSFTAEEMVPGGRRVVALSEGFWQRRYGGRRDVLGEQLELGEGSYEIVGVLPNRLGAFTGSAREAQLWLPLLPDTSEFGEPRNLLVRLSQGVDTTAAARELRTLAAGVEDRGSIDWEPQVVAPVTFVDGTARRGLPILFAAVAAVLLIGCANIAGLMLVRVNGRRREVAIRAAVGANRGAIVRLLGAESLLLAGAAGVLGVLLSVWLLELIRVSRPENLNSIDAATLSAGTLVFALCATLLAAALSGSAPAWSAVRRDLLQPLLSAGGGGARLTGGNRTRSVLVIGQIALSLTLLVVALLLVRTVRNLDGRDLGFEPGGVLALKLTLPDAAYAPEARRAFFDALLPALERLPGVQAAAQGSGVPTQLGMMFGTPEFAGRPLADDERPQMVGYVEATDAYAATVGLELVEGRYPSAAAGGIAISEQWARQLWPDGGAVGQQVRLSAKAPWLRITGVVRDLATGSQPVGGHPQVYVPGDFEYEGAWVLLRTTGAQPLALAPQVRAAIAALDPRLVPRDFTTMDALIADTIASERFFMRLVLAFAALALLLSVVGLYGVISQAVAQRSHEIGVRLALGATPAGVRRLMLGHGLRLTGLGLALGCAGVAASVKLVRSTLYGVQPWDPAALLGAGALLASAAVLATLIPAQRALRVDPLATLRAE